jgi:metal-dependent amidase/aminoacylase/carboxypeptidase family protein
MRQDIHARIKHIAEAIAEANHATAEVRIDKAVPVTVNDPALTEKMIPTLKRIGGEGGAAVSKRVMVAEDFSYFQEKVPGMFYFVGITPKDQDMTQAAPNHSPRFFIDESGLLQGTRSLAAVAVDFLTGR